MMAAIQEAFRTLIVRIRALEVAEPTGSNAEALAFVDLPAASQPGRLRFVTNGRKDGEGVGAGTGVLAYDDGVAWRACDTSATVAI
jgi:hypothetical protein